jgi:hypothetical protein
MKEIDIQGSRDDAIKTLERQLECTGFPTGKFRIRAVGTRYYWTPTRWSTHQDGNTVHIWSLGSEEKQVRKWFSINFGHQ